MAILFFIDANPARCKCTKQNRRQHILFSPERIKSYSRTKDRHKTTGMGI